MTLEETVNEQFEGKVRKTIRECERPEVSHAKSLKMSLSFGGTGFDQKEGVVQHALHDSINSDLGEMKMLNIDIRKGEVGE